MATTKTWGCPGEDFIKCVVSPTVISVQNLVIIIKDEGGPIKKH